MAVMTPPDCLEWSETPKSWPDYIKKNISGNIDLAIIVVLISNFTQPLWALLYCTNTELTFNFSNFAAPLPGTDIQ